MLLFSSTHFGTSPSKKLLCAIYTIYIFFATMSCAFFLKEDLEKRACVPLFCLRNRREERAMRSPYCWVLASRTGNKCTRMHSGSQKRKVITSSFLLKCTIKFLISQFDILSLLKSVPFTKKKDRDEMGHVMLGGLLASLLYKNNVVVGMCRDGIPALPAFYF